MNTITADVSVIRSKILEIRGNRVILDYHLAELYGVQTKVLKQAVRRNLKTNGRNWSQIVTGYPKPSSTAPLLRWLLPSRE